MLMYAEPTKRVMNIFSLCYCGEFRKRGGYTELTRGGIESFDHLHSFFYSLSFSAQHIEIRNKILLVAVKASLRINIL